MEVRSYNQNNTPTLGFKAKKISKKKINKAIVKAIDYTEKKTNEINESKAAQKLKRKVQSTVQYLQETPTEMMKQDARMKYLGAKDSVNKFFKAGKKAINTFKDEIGKK